MDSAEVQRSLGRIEGTQTQILTELKSLRVDFGEHKNDDQKNFSSLRSLVFTQRDDLKMEIAGQFKNADAARNQHLNEQDVKLDAIMTARAVLLGQLTMGQKILAAIGAFAIFVLSVTAWLYPHH